MDTEHLYARSDDAKAKVEAIDRAFSDALYKIELIAHDLQDRFGVDSKDERRFLDAASEHLQDMLGDVRQGYVEEMEAADDAISAIEERDLMRSAPVAI